MPGRRTSLLPHSWAASTKLIQAGAEPVDTKQSTAMPFGPTHLMIRSLATYALHSFFSDIQVEGAEFVPLDGEGPAIVLANHWNGAVDVSLVSLFCLYSREDGACRSRLCVFCEDGLGLAASGEGKIESVILE